MNESKSYSSENYDGSNAISNVSEAVYLTFLNSIQPLDDKTDFINNTQIEYFYYFPKYPTVAIYLGYLVISIGLIFSSKIIFKEVAHES